MSPAAIAAAILSAPDDAKLTGFVWWCHDEHCDCTQATIEQRRPNPRFRGWWDLADLWQGEFLSEGQHGASLVELRRMSELIKAERPAAWGRVRWVLVR